MSEHIVRSYDADLQGLRQRIAEMGGIAEKMLVDSVAALARHDKPLAQTVIASDPRLDVLHREVEENAILTIARRQPLAVDLRETISAIRIAGDVERIGDLAKNIAKRALAIGGDFQPHKIVVGLRHMNDLVMAQLKDVLDAYAQKDTAKALDVWKRDGAIDGEGRRKLAGATGQLAFLAAGVHAKAALHHYRDAVHRLDRADEHGRRIILFLGDRVQAPVHAVDPVDVGDTRRTEHGYVAPGSANAFGAV